MVLARSATDDKGLKICLDQSHGILRTRTNCDFDYSKRFDLDIAFTSQNICVIVTARQASAYDKL